MMSTRRTFLKGSATAGVVTAAAGIAATANAAGEAATKASFTYSPKPLPFEPAKIKGFSEKILTSHYENNYGGALKRLNANGDQPAGPDRDKGPGLLHKGPKPEGHNEGQTRQNGDAGGQNGRNKSQ